MATTMYKYIIRNIENGRKDVHTTNHYRGCPKGWEIVEEIERYVFPVPLGVEDTKKVKKEEKAPKPKKKSFLEWLFEG